MKWLVSLFLTLTSWLFAADVLPMAPDRLLGAPFEAASYTAGAQNEYQATLVRYPFGASRLARGDSLLVEGAETLVAPKATPKAAIIYVHGFNDYFFQSELAQEMDKAGYAFFAVDLHKYGRSYRQGERIGELLHISEYYAELDSAAAMVRRFHGDSIPLVLLGHSTGGLIVSLYAADRDNGKDFAAIVLNSPFLEMNYPWIVKAAGLPVLSFLGKISPKTVLPRKASGNYDRSLHQSKGGEWNYDLTLKRLGSIPVDFGWIRAIHQGHSRLQQGLRLAPPVLVMHSGCSCTESEWSEEYTRCDGVLNVEDIRKYGATLGPHVELQEIEGGLHDLYLSAEPVRQKAYRATIRFLDAQLD